jgi:hypothetical protein
MKRTKPFSWNTNDFGTVIIYRDKNDEKNHE